MKKLITSIILISAFIIVTPKQSFADFTSQCTGGTITYAGGKVIHTFTSGGTFDCTSAGTGIVDYLVVGGGGAGSSGANSGAGGGGGAGGMLTGSTTVSSQSFTITVGNGGVGAVSASGTSGGDSSFGSLATAVGGGAGGYDQANGLNGGSGGGNPGQGNSGTSATGIAGQGFDGGRTFGGHGVSSGGGGASEVGFDNTSSSGGNGGDGKTSNISGSTIVYAGGGAGAANPPSGENGEGVGGAGGGGNGGASGTDGTANTGGGGGGSDRILFTTPGRSGDGGSGIVILSYATPSSPTPTVSLTANPISIAFNASTTLTWSSTDATTCTASGDWSGSKATSGSEVENDLTSNKSYTLTCTGPGGTANDTANVAVGAQQFVDGSGTVNRLAKFIGATTLDNSLFSDDGSNVTLTSGNLFMPIGSILDSVTNGALNFGTSLATTMTFGRSGQNMIINSKVAIGTSSPLATLHVNGDLFVNVINVLANGLGLDTFTPGLLAIGSTTASSITLGHAGITTTVPGTIKVGSVGTVSNCNSTASPAVCGSAPAGSIAMATGGSTLVVNTTAVTANSQIFIIEDSSLGSRLGITCNTATTRNYRINSRIAGTSFTIKSNNNPSGSKACLSYFIVN